MRCRRADLAEVAGPVEGVKAGAREVGRVADVVDPRCRLEELAVLAELAPDQARLLGNGEYMGPASR